MKEINSDLLNSEYVTIDESGWHISDDAPEEIKAQFEQFINAAEDGMEIELS